MKRNLILLALLATLLAPTTASAATWSEAHTTRVIKRACRFYHLSPAKTRRVVRDGIDIVYRGAAESHGATKGKTGSCWGLFQFDGGWHLGKRLTKRAKRNHHKHGAMGWRGCGTCSTFRYVKAHKEGGLSAWKATLGR